MFLLWLCFLMRTSREKCIATKIFSYINSIGAFCLAIVFFLLAMTPREGSEMNPRGAFFCQATAGLRSGSRVPLCTRAV